MNQKTVLFIDFKGGVYPKIFFVYYLPDCVKILYTNVFLYRTCFSYSFSDYEQ